MITSEEELAATMSSTEADKKEIQEMMAYKEDMRDTYLGLLLGDESLPESMTP